MSLNPDYMTTKLAVEILFSSAFFWAPSLQGVTELESWCARGLGGEGAEWGQPLPTRSSGPVDESDIFKSLMHRIAATLPCPG